MPHVCASCGDAVVAARTLHPLAMLERVQYLATTLVFSPRGSCGLLISGIWDCTAHFSRNSGICVGQDDSLGLSVL